MIIISWTLIISGLILLFVYIIGKSLNIIHSPVWVDYIPHMGGGLTLLGIALQGGKTIQKINDTKDDVKEMDTKVGKLITDVTAIKTKVDAHDISIRTMDDRMHEDKKKK